MKSVALLAALVGAVFAQHWEFEQVDSGVMRSPTMARMADGRICLSYVSEDSVVWVAFRDTAWHREVVGRMEGYASPAIAVGPHGTVGVVYDSGGICYAVRNDTEWVRERLPPAGLAPRLSYDSADVPLVISGCSQNMNAYVYATWRADTGWATTTLVCTGPGFYVAESHTAGRFSSDNTAHVFTHDFWDFEHGIGGSDLSLFEGYGNQWRVAWDSAECWGCVALALALDTAGVPACCFSSPEGSLFLVDQRIDTLVSRASLQFDMLNRPHVAYIASLWSTDRLKYASRTRGTWFVAEVPDTCAVTGCDILLDSLAEPFIAYVRADGGLWLARGVDVVGQGEESKPQATSLKPQATVVRGVLWQEAYGTRQTAYRAELLDATGRRALVLKAGANDVRGLAPGVYFVREKPQAPSLKPQAVRKVVIAR